MIINTGSSILTEVEKKEDNGKIIDFKMVTFILADREYGVEIMSVKEIQKGNRFTFVPNAPYYVRGVYNLRGDIIPVIDLRRFFGISERDITDGVEDLLILREQGSAIGVIVDSIQRVVGVSSNDIQAAHPLFTDIVGLDYIYGVVEKDDCLYVILNTSVILGDVGIDEQKNQDVFKVQSSTALKEIEVISKKSNVSQDESISSSSDILLNQKMVTSVSDSQLVNICNSENSKVVSSGKEDQINIAFAKESRQVLVNTKEKDTTVEDNSTPFKCDIVHEFMKENEDSLKSDLYSKDSEIVKHLEEKTTKIVEDSLLDDKLRTSINDSFLEQLFNGSGFCASELNQTWLQDRYSSWINKYDEKEKSLENQEKVLDFLQGFYSRKMKLLWDENMLDEFYKLTIIFSNRAVHVWDVNCGYGSAAYSIAAGLFLRDRSCKIYATDGSFEIVMNAPGIGFNDNEISNELKVVMVESPKGFKFSNDIKNNIIFEYHDIANTHVFPHLDIIVARDVLSFVNEEVYMKFFEKIDGQVEQDALLIVGDNEVITGREDWVSVPNEFFSLYRKV